MFKRKKQLWIMVTLMILLVMIGSFHVAAASAASKAAEPNIETKAYTVQAQDDYQLQDTPSIFGLFIRLVVSVAIIGGLAYLTLKLLRRKLRQQSAGEFISVFDQYSLGVNKGIYVVEVAGKVLTLGVTDENINVLAQIEDPEMIAEMRSKMLDRQGDLPINSGFSGYFNQFIGGKVNSGDFKTHIQSQINKLQNLNLGTGKRGDDERD